MTKHQHTIITKLASASTGESRGDADPSEKFARQSMPGIPPLTDYIDPQSAEFRIFQKDLCHDLTLVLGDLVRDFRASLVNGRLRIQCTLRDGIKTPQSNDIERLVRRISQPMPIEFVVKNDTARQPTIVAFIQESDRCARVASSTSSSVDPLEESIKETIPLGAYPGKPLRFEFAMGDGIVRGIHLTVSIPKGLEDDVEQWRRTFEQSHELRVHVRKEWVRASLERSLRRIQDNSPLLTDDHIPAIRKQLDRWFGTPPGFFPNQPPRQLVEQAVDLRHLPFVTIDQQGTLNPEDALYARREADGGYTLYAAVTDVTWAIHPHSPSANHAADRAVSIYAGTHSYPLLGRQFGNTLASFSEGEDRLAWVVTMKVSPNGIVSETRVEQAHLTNHAALSPQTAALAKDNPALPVGVLVEVSQRLRAQATNQSSFVRATPSEGDVDSIVPACMQALYTEVGRILADSGRGALFTTYAAPSLRQRTLLAHRITANGVPATVDDFSDAARFIALWDRMATSESIPPALLAETLDRFFPRSLLEPFPENHQAFGESQPYARLKADSYAGLVNQWVIAALVAGEPPPFSSDELQKIASKQNRKRSSIASMTLQVKVMNMLARNLKCVGQVFDAEIASSSPQGTLITVLDQRFSKQCLLETLGDPPTEGTRIGAVLRGFDGKHNRFVFALASVDGGSLEQNSNSF